MINSYEDAFLWYSENAHRIDRFEFVEDDGSRRPLTNTEMYWLTKIKQAEEDGVDVPTDPQAQLEQALQDNTTLRGLLREVADEWDRINGWIMQHPTRPAMPITLLRKWRNRVTAALEGKQ